MTIDEIVLGKTGVGKLDVTSLHGGKSHDELKILQRCQEYVGWASAQAVIMHGKLLVFITQFILFIAQFIQENFSCIIPTLFAYFLACHPYIFL